MKALRHYLGSDIMLEVKPWGIDSLADRFPTDTKP
jgi:hypothetical protein